MIFKVLVEEEEEVFTEEEVEEITPRRDPSQRKVAMVKYSVLNFFHCNQRLHLYVHLIYLIWRTVSSVLILFKGVGVFWGFHFRKFHSGWTEVIAIQNYWYCLFFPLSMSTRTNKLICYWHPNLIALYGRWALKELLRDFPPRNFLKRRFCPKVHKLTSSSFAKVERSDVMGYAERVMLHSPTVKTSHQPWPSGFHLKSICQHWNLQFCQTCMQFLHQAMESTLALRLSSNNFSLNLLKFVSLQGRTSSWALCCQVVEESWKPQMPASPFNPRLPWTCLLEESNQRSILEKFIYLQGFSFRSFSLVVLLNQVYLFGPRPFGIIVVGCVLRHDKGSNSRI